MDIRKKITNKKIIDAYIEVMMHQNKLEVSVKDVCEKADINRSTFYEYYESIFDLKKRVISEKLYQIIKTNSQAFDVYHYKKYENSNVMKHYIETFLKDKVLIRLLKSSEQPEIELLIPRVAMSYEMHRYEITDINERAKIIHRTAGAFYVLFAWMHHKIEMTIDELAEFLYQKSLEYK